MTIVYKTEIDKKSAFKFVNIDIYFIPDQRKFLMVWLWIGPSLHELLLEILLTVLQLDFFSKINFKG